MPTTPDQVQYPWRTRTYTAYDMSYCRYWSGRARCLCVDSREQAFVQSLSTAVLVQAVAKACSTGLSSHCGCGPVPSQPPPDDLSDQFQWGGCPDDVPHGLTFSRSFERTRASTNKRRKVSRRALFNQHNSDVGREVGAAVRQMSHYIDYFQLPR